MLVADDEPGVRLLLHKALSAAGFEVLTAADGQEAWTIAEQQPVDLILTDVNMPGMDGHTLLRRVRQLKPDLPVIVMTSEASFDTIHATFAARAQTFFAKPFHDVNEVVSKVGKVIRRARERSTEETGA